jgi:hypothetical protein
MRKKPEDLGSTDKWRNAEEMLLKEIQALIILPIWGLSGTLTLVYSVPFILCI